MSALVPVTALLLSAAILLTGHGLQGVLLPVRGSLEGFASLEIALIGSCYFGGFVAGCFLGPSLVKRAGHIRVFTAMTAAASAAALAHGLLVVPVGWWILRAVTGFCLAVLYLVIESWLNERATPQNRGFVLSAYMVINLTVLTVGQMLLPLADPMGLVLFAIVAMLISIAAIPVSLTASVAPAPINSTRIRLRHLYQVSPVGVVGCAVVGAANGAFWSLGPLFAENRVIDTTGIAIFMSATVLGGAIGQWPLGYLSDRVDRRIVIIAAATLAVGAGLLLQTSPFDSVLLLTLTAVAWGAVAFPLYSLAVAHANDFAGSDEFVEVSGSLLLVYGAGAILGPIVASALSGVLGAGYLYGFTAIVHGGLLVYTGIRMRTRQQAEAEDHVDFISALQATQTVSPVFDEETQRKLQDERPE